MIRSNSEYKDAFRRIQAEKRSLADHEAKLKGMGLSDAQIAVGMAPLRTFHRMFAEEVEQYARLRNRDFSGLHDLHDLGRILVGARIANRMSGRALARKLGVDESQVSRDERNEYAGVTVERASGILEALNVELKVECKMRAVNCEIKRDYKLAMPSPRHYNSIEVQSEAISPIMPPNQPPRAAA